MNTLKNIIGIIAFLLIGFVAMAQNTTIQFVGKDRTGNDYVRLNHVSVFDEDQLWHEMLYYPDTTLFLGPVSVEDYAMQDFRLMQNVPNPFKGTTDIALSLPDVRDVTLEIYDMLGKVLVKQSFPSLQEGTHLFRASMTSPQTYLLSATTKDGKTSIKMVNEGVAATNIIEYIGMTNPQGGLSLFLNESKGAGSYPFNTGDKMKYTGYALIDDEMRSSEVVQKKQYNNETIQLKFDVERPVVETGTPYSLSASSLCFNGEVASDNNASVTERGFCYATHNAPTLNDSWISVGTGVGLYTTNVTDLTAGTVYYVRAYAINAIGVSYGSIKSIRTHDTIPEVTTTVPSQITINSFVSGGNVLTNNGAAVTMRGVCWSTSPNPTTADDHTVDGSGLGTFTSSIGGLECGTTYYVRAYATNSVGTAYGDTYSVTTLSTGIPEVTTNNVFDVTSNSAVCGGVVIHDGCDMVTARGVCWSTSQNPTVSDSHTTDGSGTSSFTSSITGLTAGTTYYVRAYATNSEGTAYGIQVSFTAISSTNGQPCPGAATVIDIDNNTYNTVQIGDQCWMRENLRTTRYADGTTIALGSDTSTTTPYCYNRNNNANYVPTYGYLYNWPAVMHGASSSSANPSGVQGLCPNGWHVPSRAEWIQLRNYVGNQPQYQCNNSSDNIAKALASTTGWNSNSQTCRVGNNPNTNNATGFSALPASGYINNHYGAIGSQTSFWSSNGTLSVAYRCDVYSSGAEAVISLSVRSCGFSVRCVKDVATEPTVTTTSVTSITGNSATCGGNVTSDGGATVTARGVCWSTSQNPTVSDSHTTDGSGTGSFTSNITGLTAGTTYYVRAYATNSEGTAYGEEVSFTTENDQPCSSTPTVTDIDGNVYNTVQIGDQCWMRENLRTTRYADGITIPLVTSTSTTTSYRYNPDNDANNVPTYGYLYNWPAVMNGATSSSANPSGVQGVCPDGWHVPSDAEWTQLTDYVSSQTQYQCNNSSDNIAKALASKKGWKSSTYTCSVGNNPGTNNATGFSALPASAYFERYYGRFSEYAYFWSATEGSSNSGYYRQLGPYSINLYRGLYFKNYGISVRCVRD